MIEPHVMTLRHVEVGAQQVPDERDRLVMRDVEWSGRRIPVTDRVRLRANSECGHQLVDEAVEVIRRELDHIMGIEVADRGGERGESSRHPAADFVGTRPIAHQRRMGGAGELERHWRFLVPRRGLKGVARRLSRRVTIRSRTIGGRGGATIALRDRCTWCTPQADGDRVQAGAGA